MEELDGRVAVITGGASGLGLAFAHRFAAEGMRLVLADVEQPALDEAVASLRADGTDVLGVVTDVSDAAAMDRLAAAAFERFERVHVVCNNAGVSGRVAPVAELTPDDWSWVLGVDLWGVIHGHRVFQRHLMEHGDGHIVNTSSIAGHTAFADFGPYHVAKHGVVVLSEVVRNELAAANSSVGISVLSPGFVNTRIGESDRNRPETLPDPIIADPAEDAELRRLVRDFFDAQKPPADVADLVVDAIRSNRFYVFSDDVWDDAIAERHADIAQRRDPRPKGNLIEAAMLAQPTPTTG